MSIVVAAKDDYLIDTLRDLGLLTDSQIDEARPDAESAGEGLLDTLVKRGTLDSRAVVTAKATYFGVEAVDLAGMRLADDVIAAVPRTVARKYNAIPVAVTDGTVVVAIADPSDIESLDGLAVSLGKAVEHRVATEGDIQGALGKYYGGSGRDDSGISKMIQDITEGEVEVGKLGKLEDGGEELDADAPIIKLDRKSTRLNSSHT